MKRTGTASLPLHYGNAPRWLFNRMVRLSSAIVAVIVDEYGIEEFLRRVSDPFWFQALSCVIGFDWHSSGTTTVTCGALKTAMSKENLGIGVAGGKGRVSRRAPLEIESIGETLGLSTVSIEKLKYSSRMSAKVDNTAIQDYHQLYHHVFFFTHKGKWAVVQQGINAETKYARRYHWLSSNVTSFVEEPHTSILGESRFEKVLNMTAKESKECRKVTVDLVKDNPEKLRECLRMNAREQSTLDDWLSGMEKRLFMPWQVNWKALKRAYEFQPKDYEEFLSIEGIGPSTVRALALISDVIYGSPPSWKDPIKFSFAVGGKDGVPYPVNKRVMDKSTQILEKGIEDAKLGNKEKLQALKRLRDFLPDDFEGS